MEVCATLARVRRKIQRMLPPPKRIKGDSPVPVAARLYRVQRVGGTVAIIAWRRSDRWDEKTAVLGEPAPPGGHGGVWLPVVHLEGKTTWQGSWPWLSSTGRALGVDVIRRRTRSRGSAFAIHGGVRRNRGNERDCATWEDYRHDARLRSHRSSSHDRTSACSQVEITGKYLSQAM